MTQLSQNFNSKELRCRCCGVALVDHHLIYKLQHARDLYGKPMRITSGYRCKKHNRAVGGVPNSYHTQGKAADVSCPAEDWDDMVAAFKEAGFERMGFYRGQGFIHVDVGESPSPAHWEG
jgi:zinc D-Ala-D-Ala carboxypeptidase